MTSGPSTLLPRHDRGRSRSKAGGQLDAIGALDAALVRHLDTAVL